MNVQTIHGGLEMAKGPGIEASHFCYTVESSPYLVRMDLVVS